MIIKRIFNNNVILVVDDQEKEKMLLGKGIGFHKKVNDSIDEHGVDKIYVLENDAQKKQFEELATNVPASHLILTKKIVDMAEGYLKVKYSNGIYAGLADHISFTLTRAQNGEFLSNALLWEIKKFYRKEFEAAVEALQIIKDQTGIELTEDEAAFIAFHFITGQQQDHQVKENTRHTISIIQDILEIVQSHYQMEFDEDSLNFIRFVTHLRYYLQRRGHEHSDATQDSYLFNQVRKKYPDAFECVVKIKKYLKNRLNVELSEEEQLYFMLHTQRLTNREKQNTNHELGL